MKERDCECAAHSAPFNSRSWRATALWSISAFLSWLASHAAEDVDFSLAPKLPNRLEEPRQIVARIERVSKQVEHAQRLRAEAVVALDALRSGILREAYASLTNRYGAVELGSLLEDAGYGTSQHCTAGRDSGALPVLRIPNIASETVAFNDLKFAVLEKWAVEKLSLRRGDILLVRTNGSVDLVGRTAVMPKPPERMAFASYLIRLRFDTSKVDADFAQRMLRHLRVSGKLVDLARTTAGQYNVSLGRLRSASIPLPAVEEQRRIVSALDSQERTLSQAFALQKEASAELNALLPSILDRAFAGAL